MKRIISFTAQFSLIFLLFLLGCREHATEPNQPSTPIYHSLNKADGAFADCQIVADLYSGAEKNDLEKGEDVGDVYLYLKDDMINVEYDMKPGWFLVEAHLWISAGPAEAGSKKGGKNSWEGVGNFPKNAAPGKFPFKAEFSEYISNYTFIIDPADPNLGLSGDPCNAVLNLAAHAVVIKADSEEEDKESVWGYDPEFADGGCTQTFVDLGISKKWGGVFCGEVFCASSCDGIIYITDAGPRRPTTLNMVELNDNNGTATITEIFNFAVGSSGSDYNSRHFRSHVHIGASPDGSLIYVVDGNYGYMGIYNVADNIFTEVGLLHTPGGNLIRKLVQVAVSPEGVVYVASNLTDRVYRVDGGSLYSLGASGVDIQGADLNFAQDGNLYMYCNPDKMLYKINLETGKAFDGVAISSGSITGLATHPESGALLMSDTGNNPEDSPNYIIKINLDGTEEVKYEITGFDHYWGDMSSTGCSD